MGKIEFSQIVSVRLEGGDPPPPSGQPARFFTFFLNPSLSVLGGIFLGKKLQVISTIGRGAGGPHPCLKKLGKLIWFLQAQDSLTTKTTTTSITIMWLLFLWILFEQASLTGLCHLIQCSGDISIRKIKHEAGEIAVFSQSWKVPWLHKELPPLLRDW